MKNFIKATVLVAALALAFAAVSCSPPEYDISKYDWKEVNAGNDPKLNSGSYVYADVVPTATITEVNDFVTTINGFNITITFPENADVLRGEITAASLEFINFFTFTTATAALTADTLSATPLAFTVENRVANNIFVKVTANISMSGAYSTLVMRVDAKKYTFDHGIRMDIDQNGKIEAGYDDYAYEELSYPYGYSPSINNFTPPGQIDGLSIDFASFPNITTVATAPGTTNVNDFYFVGSATTTNSNTLIVSDDSYYEISGTDAAAINLAFKDICDKLASGIKLQKLSGEAWEDKGAAEYVGAAADSTQGYIVIKNVSFDHLGTYRLFWAGSAYTETASAYYGVKQRVYIVGDYDPIGEPDPDPDYFVPPDAPAKRYTRTVVAGDPKTLYNTDLVEFYPSSAFGSGPGNDISLTRYSYDNEGRNNVLRLQTANGGSAANQYFWETVALADFKKNFKVAYSLTGNQNSSLFASADLVYVDIKDISYAAEDWAAAGAAAALGNNTLYITLDPKFKYGSVGSNSNVKLYFLINNGISAKNKDTPVKTKYFGTADYGASFFDFVQFYGPF